MPTGVYERKRLYTIVNFEILVLVYKDKKPEERPALANKFHVYNFVYHSIHGVYERILRYTIVYIAKKSTKN